MSSQPSVVVLFCLVGGRGEEMREVRLWISRAARPLPTLTSGLHL